GAGGGAAVAGGLFRIGTEGGDAAALLDPHKSFGDRMNSFICASFYEQINIIGNSGSITNVLAEELTPNETGDVWTLRIKEGVEFHHGKTLDADDVIFSIERILDPELGATARSQFTQIKTMKALDANTVELTLKSPMSWFDLNIADGGIMGLVPVDFDLENPVSTGPFKLVAYDKNGLVQFERFDNYHGQVASFDELEIHGIVDDDTRINALLSGQLDAAKIPPIQAARVEAGTGYLTTDAPTSYIFPLTMKVNGDGPFSNVDARQAMRYAIDRQQVLDAVYGGRGRVASDIYGAFDPNLDTSLQRSQDLTKAKELAEKSGLTTAGTIPLTVTASYEPLAKVMAENAKEIGVDLRVDVLQPGEYWADNPGDKWDFSAEGFPLTHVLPMAALADGPEPGFNMTGFSDDEFNEAFEQASLTMDPDEQAAAVKRLQEIQFERGGFIVPVYTNTVYGYNEKVVGMIEEDASGLGINRSFNSLAFAE
ncbi:ABC transporter substrate-binding protein, partial [Leucobacter soli]